MDNPRKTYLSLMKDNNFPSHLTGITDENGDRYATFAYADDGKAVLTEHAQTVNSAPQERFQLDFTVGE